MKFLHHLTYLRCISIEYFLEPENAGILVPRHLRTPLSAQRREFPTHTKPIAFFIPPLSLWSIWILRSIELAGWTPSNAVMF